MSVIYTCPQCKSQMVLETAIPNMKCQKCRIPMEMTELPPAASAPEIKVAAPVNMAVPGQAPIVPPAGVQPPVAQQSQAAYGTPNTMGAGMGTAT
ncbi:MAG: hypothetical protein J6866_00925, partial [Victivallales bacterium]|nr:hypothetical protein [Victivallales bacterium]